MTHKCFISFKKEDARYKEAIQNLPNIDIVDKSLDEWIDSHDEDYIMKKIREENLSDSTVTIFLIGSKSAENFGWDEQRFIKRELRASLYNGENNTRNGILGVVLPDVHQQIYNGNGNCSTCGNIVGFVDMTDGTVIKEFHVNYYISPEKCHHTEEDRYCILTSWDKFEANPNLYIEQAFSKRATPSAEKVTVRPE